MMPISAAHCTGVLPWRRIISSTSLTPCAMCTVKGIRRSFAAARASRSSSAEQVSICIGETTPPSLPEGCFAAASITLSAVAKRSRPSGSSQTYFRSYSFSSFQRADAKPGAR